MPCGRSRAAAASKTVGDGATYSIAGESVAVSAPGGESRFKLTYSITGAGAAQDEDGADATFSVTGAGAT